ncbi:NAD(P)/FAD-dependent oxidoreductase [Larkinella rosea]|uniref:NAD(P)/FAD-dependent oxidoreductase n=1 Tax=Larkinella rosea TaxID=2025312 RepID=A0A3P1C0B5_9BACT|nr:NAD(P)/FAD-dependent oxidoreductase [Larkinella rosea]RRB06777.1 NAD(P)/FAD-dependent oxidoreductase [Larkinella rosea]
MDAIIIGGGLAGLISGLELARAGHSVTVIERKTYPFHKVCGEYVSNEVRPYLESLGVDLQTLGATHIDRFQFSAPSGRLLETQLDMGGFGLSRYTLDASLYQLAQSAGVRFLLGKQAENVLFTNNTFSVELNDGQSITSRLVIGSYGKRSKIDKQLQRSFLQNASPYVGVKYHIRIDAPANTISLHNFRNGYCGLSSIEDDKFCLCYLTTRADLRAFGTIPALERAVLFQNPHLKRIYENADFLYEKPEVINEFSFANKRAVEQHVLMAGDSAGLITPLCGNGMAMAIHSGKLLGQLSSSYLRNKRTREQLEQRYEKEWKSRFARRLWVGRSVQRLFGDKWLSEMAVLAFGAFKPLLRGVIQQTHGPVLTSTPSIPE